MGYILSSTKKTATISAAVFYRQKLVFRCAAVFVSDCRVVRFFVVSVVDVKFQIFVGRKRLRKLVLAIFFSAVKRNCKSARSAQLEVLDIVSSEFVDESAIRIAEFGKSARGRIHSQNPKAVIFAVIPSALKRT